VFPQAEHARFAGAIALGWADGPALPFSSFVRGVADHDRGYGEHDDDPIGGVMGEDRWLAIQRRGFAPRGEDPVVDLVVALHVRRLIGEGEAFDEVDALIPSLLEAAGVTREEAEAADAITNVCDVVSFEFCFEEPNERDVRGFHVAVDGEGGVEIDPWPLALPRLVGLVTAFEADGYPERLVPVVVPFELSGR
jgi:hypothetical protein